MVEIIAKIPGTKASLVDRIMLRESTTGLAHLPTLHTNPWATGGGCHERGEKGRDGKWRERWQEVGRWDLEKLCHDTCGTRTALMVSRMLTFLSHLPPRTLTSLSLPPPIGSSSLENHQPTPLSLHLRGVSHGQLPPEGIRRCCKARLCVTTRPLDHLSCRDGTFSCR